MEKESQILRGLEAENMLLIGWIDKTLEPSIALLSLDVLVREMENDIYLHIEKKGKSQATDKSLERVSKILDLIEKLNVTVNQNNTYHLIAKHASIQIHNLQVENYKLKKELEATIKAHNAE